MKRFISAVLILTMLLSLFSVNVLAENTDREEFLNDRNFRYVPLEDLANADLFASWTDICNYGRFNKSADGTTTVNFAKVTYGNDEIFNWIPMTTNDNKPVEGTEAYYSKGFKKASATTAIAGHVYLIDDLLGENGETVKGYRYQANASNTAGEAYNGVIKRGTTPVTRTVNNSHIIEKTGKYVIAENNGIEHKIGPLSATEVSENAVFITGSNVTVAVGDKADYLSLLLATNDVNSHNTTKENTAVGVVPEAVIQTIVINYADGHSEKKYTLIGNVGKATATLDGNLIVYAEKKTDGSEWTEDDFYGNNKKTFKFLNSNNKAEHQVDFSTLTAADVTFKNPDIIMSDTAKIAQVVSARQDSCVNSYGNKGNIATFDLGGREVSSVTFESNYVYTKIPTAIGISDSTTDVRAAIIPVTVSGASDKYDYFVYVGGLCNNGVLISATLFDEKLQDKIDIIEAEIAKLSDTYVVAEGEKIAEIYQQMENLKKEGVLSTDFDAKKYAKIQDLYEEHENFATQNQAIKELTAIFDSLPESYSKDAGKAAADAKSIIDSLTKIGVTEDYIKSLTNNYGRYESYLALHNEWLDVDNSQDRIKINWQEKNPLTCVDMFEFGTVQSVDEIAYKQGIVMSSNNTTHYPATVPNGSFIGFYNTTTVKKNYPDTFPDKFGEYYVTPSNNMQYSYSGISEKIGDITYNAGLVSPSNSYEIAFDGRTKYNQVSFLMSGIVFLAGEYARQAQVAKTTVYFADGTSKEQFHIVGPFSYSYRMNLYSTLQDKSVIYSEYLGNSALGRSLDRTWYPEEANIDTYFKMGDGIRIYNEQKDGAYLKKIGGDTTLGYATAITINTNNKPVDRVAVSYATVDEIKALGGVAYNTYTTKETTPQVRNSSNSYFIPIDSQQLKNTASYEANRDYYIGVIHNTSYPVYLHAVTASKTTATSYKEDIAELEAEIEAFPEEFDVSIFEDLKAVKRRVDFLLNQGVSKGDFDSALMEKLTRISEYNIGADGSYEVHVSPYGNDKGSGSENDPLKTLDGARLFVRNLVKDRPVNVIFQEGTYYLDKTVVFTIDDSGKEGFPVTYKAEGNAVFTTANSVDFNDFTLVKEGEDSRIPTDLIGKIYKADLDLLGIDAGDMPEFYSTNIGGDGFEDVNFFVNDKEQLVSQWPNGEGNYDTWVSIEDNNINAAVIKVDALRSKNWQGEKHAYFEGYPSVDYSNERNNLTIDGDLIKFKNAARFSPDENHSRRYKVKHLLSELDMPGEWYLDRDTNIFYYYPTEDFDENANIQFSSVKLDAVNVINADYVNFDGIKFDKIRGTAFTAGAGVEELNLYNCEFTNISNRAVSYNGTSNYSGKLTGVANFLDAAKNCEVRNNRFINIGESAIYFAGGERETLSNGDNVIANNYIYNASNKLRCNPNINVSGAYNYALNNEVHMGTFHAINHSGNENVLAYNELYNMLRDTGDCGVIYNGRQLATRGTEIAYNYIHDYKHLDDRTQDNGVGVYLDDRLSGISIHHNIIFSNGVGEDANGIQNGGGQHNKINYNTIVDADEAMTRLNRFVEAYKLNADCTAFDEIIRISGMADTDKVLLDDGNYKTYSMIGRNELYFEKYPEMNDSIETLLNPNVTVPQFVAKYPIVTRINPQIQTDINNGADLTKYRILSMKATLGNEYIGNISNTPWRAMTDKDANGTVYDVYKEFGSTIKDNVQNATQSTFVDYAGRDFRIKGETGGGALDESFNLSTIGIQEDGTVAYDLGFELNDVKVNNAKALPSEYKEFNLTYPENNGRVDDKKNITFMWERPVSSDYFTLEIATDPQMNNIVYKNENAYYNFDKVTTLPENVDTFYWRVTARNLGKDDGSKWQNSDGINVFHTYDMAIVEVPANVPFDIEGDFNVDVFNNEGETHNDKNLLGGTNATLGMYNLTNFKRLVPADGYFKYGETIYKFPQVGYDTSKNNAISTKTHYDSFSTWDKILGRATEYAYTLKTSEQGSYDKIKLAISASKHMEDYEITVNYTDNSKTVAKVYLYQYYTTYNAKAGADIILTVDGVNYQGNAVSTSNKNKIYEAVIDTDETKTVKSISFGRVDNEYIFAMTGVKTERTLPNGDVEKPIVLNNYSGEAKDIVIVITGNDNGKFRAVLLEDKVANSFAYPTVTVTIPAEVYEWTDRKVFIWENIVNMKPLAAKTTFFK